MIGRQNLPAGVRENYFEREFVMKRFWHTWLMMVALATMVSTASAQSGSRSAPEIGSYQSILSRAGYGDVNPGAGYAQPAPAYGCPSGGCGGGAVVAPPTYTQPQGSFGYQSGAQVDTFNAPVQQQYAPVQQQYACLLYTSPSPRDRTRSRMPSSA